MKKYALIVLSLLFLMSCTHRVRECDKWNQGIIISIVKYGKHGKVLVQFEDGDCREIKWKYPKIGLFKTEYCVCEKYVKRK